VLKHPGHAYAYRYQYRIIVHSFAENKFYERLAKSSQIGRGWGRGRGRGRGGPNDERARRPLSAWHKDTYGHTVSLCQREARRPLSAWHKDTTRLAVYLYQCDARRPLSAHPALVGPPPRPAPPHRGAACVPRIYYHSVLATPCGLSCATLREAARFQLHSPTRSGRAAPPPSRAHR
jgi:hypothetical protein